MPPSTDTQLQTFWQKHPDNIVAIAAGDAPFQTQAIQALLANPPNTVEVWNRTKTRVNEENQPCTYIALHG